MKEMEMTTQRKTALITGAGRNIGRAIALDLARMGCNVIINGSRKREACEAVAADARARRSQQIAECEKIIAAERVKLL